MKRKLFIASIAGLMAFTAPIGVFADVEGGAAIETENIQKAPEDWLKNLGLEESKFKDLVKSWGIGEESNIKKAEFAEVKFAPDSSSKTDASFNPFGTDFKVLTKTDDRYALVIEYKDGTKKAFIGADSAKIEEMNLKSGPDKGPIFVVIADLKSGENFVDVSGKSKDGKEFSGRLNIDMSKTLTEAIKSAASDNNGNSSNNSNNSNSSNAEEKVYKVPVMLLKRGSNEKAKGSDGILSNAIVVEKGGKADIYLEAVGVEGENNLGFIENIYYYEDNNTSGTRKKAEIMQTVKFKSNEGKEYIRPKVFKISRNKTGESNIPVMIDADDRNMFDMEADLALYYDKKRVANASDIPQEGQIDGSKKDNPPVTPDEPTTPSTPSTPSTSSKSTPTTHTTTTTAKDGKKLPQTGSPIDTAVMVSFGTASLLAGLWLYRKK